MDLPILYLSKYIIENKNEYYKRLRSVTEKEEWPQWILYILKGVKETSDFTASKITQIKDLVSQTIEEAKAKLPSRVYSKELVELIFEEPYCKTEFVVNAGIAKRQTAAEYLKGIRENWFFKKQKSRQRSFIFERTVE